MQKKSQVKTVKCSSYILTSKKNRYSVGDSHINNCHRGTEINDPPWFTFNVCYRTFRQVAISVDSQVGRMLETII